MFNDPNEAIIDETTGEEMQFFKYQFMNETGQKKKGKLITVVPENPEEFELLQYAFKNGSDDNIDDKATNYVKSSQIKIEVEQGKNPIAKRAFINRISSGLRAAPEVLTFSDKKEHKTKNPKNIASGLGYGGIALAKGIFSGVTGIVTEPYKGAKKDGLKGSVKGLGRGLIGVVAKPTAGVVGMVGCTVQGTINTPGTIAKAVKKDKKKGGDGTAAGIDISDEEERKGDAADDVDDQESTAKTADFNSQQ